MAQTRSKRHPPPVVRPFYGFSFRTMYAIGRHNSLHVHTPRGHKRAAMVIEASTAATGRLKNGRMLPSDLMSEVTKLCSTIVPMTMPSTIAATG
jgi:hypothetical protein